MNNTIFHIIAAWSLFGCYKFRISNGHQRLFPVCSNLKFHGYKANSKGTDPGFTFCLILFAFSSLTMMLQHKRNNLARSGWSIKPIDTRARFEQTNVPNDATCHHNIDICYASWRGVLFTRGKYFCQKIGYTRLKLNVNGSSIDRFL